MLLLAACTGTPALDPSRPTIGFVLVGGREDLGYNQAVAEGIDAVMRAFPDATVLRREHVPETDAAAEAMRALIEDGARIVFATSFGYLDAAVEVARAHPDVIVVHQGGIEPSPGLPNLGTYWGSVYEPVYLAGIAAGAESGTGRLGFVAAFPIPATFANVNAFTLGARSIRPDARTAIAFTGDWCDPVAQQVAARRLLARGVDVLTQHQDCTRTILEIAEEAGIASVGYHADGSEVAPDGWLAGSAWNWGPTFVAIVRTALQGRFAGSTFDGDHRGSYADASTPFVLTELSARVDARARRAIERAEDRFLQGGSPFAGPIRDRDGTLRIPAGKTPTIDDADRMTYLVEGVVGTVPAA